MTNGHLLCRKYMQRYNTAILAYHAIIPLYYIITLYHYTSVHLSNLYSPKAYYMVFVSFKSQDGCHWQLQELVTLRTTRVHRDCVVFFRSLLFFFSPSHCIACPSIYGLVKLPWTQYPVKC